MTPFRLVSLLACLFLLQNCTEKVPVDPTPLNADMVPANAQPMGSNVSHINCWVEKDMVFVTGICANTTEAWQKIWLDVSPLSPTGKPLAILNHSSVIVNTFSDAVAPYGRTSFFASFPLANFSGKPDSCIVKVAGVTPQAPGPVLIAPVVNGMLMSSPASAGMASVEAWYASGTISNPLQMVASKPRLEVLIYGTDNKLWYSTLLNPEDPAVQSFFSFERKGPLQPEESRVFTLQVYYQSLPQALKDLKIGRVVILPFEAR